MLCIVFCLISDGYCSVCDKIAEYFQDEDGCYKKYVMDIIPFCNGQFTDGAFEIIQMAVFVISILLFCASCTGKDTYRIRKRIAIFGTMMAFITVVVAVIKIIVTFYVEENKAKAGWELGMFIITTLVSCCCCLIGREYPCIPISLCLPILLIIAETIKNLATDDSSCLHPYRYR